MLVYQKNLQLLRFGPALCSSRTPRPCTGIAADWSVESGIDCTATRGWYPDPEIARFALKTAPAQSARLLLRTPHEARSRDGSAEWGYEHRLFDIDNLATMGSHFSNNRASRELSFGTHRGAARTPSAVSSSGTRSPSQASSQALTDQRFHDLLKNAGEFFTRSEQADAGAKLAAIAEIRSLMDRFELTVHDLE